MLLKLVTNPDRRIIKSITAHRAGKAYRCSVIYSLSFAHLYWQRAKYDQISDSRYDNPGQVLLKSCKLLTSKPFIAVFPGSTGSR